MHASGRRSLLLAGAALAVQGCASSAPAVSLKGAAPVVLPGTRQLDITSGGHVHRLFVSAPAAAAPAGGWPVLYVLDGNSLFPLVAQLVRHQSIRGDAAAAASAVVVGLGYATDSLMDTEARAWDYTPVFAGSAAATDPASRRREGGAEAFLDFIEQRVKPLVAGEFAVDAARQTLLGHSYGGLLTLHTLFTRPAMFRNYVAASPSIWWRDRAILNERDSFLGKAGWPAGTRLLVTSGSLEEPTAPEGSPRTALLRQRRQIGNARDLAGSLQGRPGLRADFTLFDGEDHGSTVTRAAAAAIALALQA